MIAIAGLTNSIAVRNYGNWKSRSYNPNGVLKEFHSVEWYLQYTKDNSDGRGQLDAGQLHKLFWNEPWQKTDPHYDVLITSADLYDARNGVRETNWIFGSAIPGFSLVASTFRPRAEFRNETTYLEVLKTGVMHEFGHVIGLPNENRGYALEENLGGHCTNRCIMRQRVRIAEWGEITADRLNHGALCRDCLRDLSRGIPDLRR